jgi:hypothetical protein
MRSRLIPCLCALALAVPAGAQTAPAKPNAELARLYEEDQQDRSGGSGQDGMGTRDADRKKRVLEIVEQGALKESADYFHAAMVLQHGDSPEDYKRAHELCLKAVDLDSGNEDARWLAAASLDRYLMSQGKPQLYGTQTRKVDGKWVLWNVDPSITDEERAKWKVPPLAEARQRAEKMNPSFAEAFNQASDLYEKANWAGCAQQFVAASAAAAEDRQASRALLRAASCAARAGEKATDFAFQFLDQAAARGCRDVDRLGTDPDLATLRTDPRWKPVFEKIQARAVAARKGPLNPELARLYNEDQGDRAGELATSDWAAVEKRDADRRKLVLEIVESGGAKEAADYIHAAMVFQHGTTPEDYDHANRWSTKAVELDPDYPGARWLAAASKDRYLMNLGKPQLYGTQFKKDGTGPWYLWSVDPAVTDEERAKWDVPPLSRAKARVEALNAGTFEPH